MAISGGVLCEIFCTLPTYINLTNRPSPRGTGRQQSTAAQQRCVCSSGGVQQRWASAVWSSGGNEQQQWAAADSGRVQEQ